MIRRAPLLMVLSYTHTFLGNIMVCLFMTAKNNYLEKYGKILARNENFKEINPLKLCNLNS